MAAGWPLICLSTIFIGGCSREVSWFKCSSAWTSAAQELFISSAHVNLVTSQEASEEGRLSPINFFRRHVPFIGVSYITIKAGRPIVNSATRLVGSVDAGPNYRSRFAVSDLGLHTLQIFGWPSRSLARLCTHSGATESRLVESPAERERELRLADSVVRLFKQNVFIHRNHKLNKWVQETLKPHACLFECSKLSINVVTET